MGSVGSLLVITDEASVAERLRDLLVGAGVPSADVQVHGAKDLGTVRADRFGVALVHDCPPTLDALSVPDTLRAQGSELPWIAVAEACDDARTGALLQGGAADVVCLDHVVRLWPAVQRELRQAERRRACDRAEAEVARLAAIVSSAEPAIMSRSLDGRATSWNAGAERLFGFTAAEMLGSTGSTLLPDAERDRMAELRRRLGEGCPSVTFDTVRPHKNGASLNVSLSVAPTRGPDGTVNGFSVIATDITARKQAEQVLKDSEARLREILDTMSNIVWMSGVTGTLDYVNQRGVELLGVEPTKLQDTDFLRLIHPEDLDTVLAVWARTRAARDSFKFECRLRLADGRFRWYSVEGTPIFSAEAGRRRWVGACTDIDDRVLAAEESKRTAELLTAVAAATPDAFYVKDTQHRYLLINPAYARFLGRPVEELLGLTDHDLFPREEADAIVARDRLVMDTGQTIAAEHRLTVGGLVLDLFSTKGPYRDVSGEIAGVIGVSRNITDELSTLRSLRLRERAIEAASQGFIISDARAPGNPIIYVSPGVERITGYQATDFLGGHADFLHGASREPGAVEDARVALLDGGTHGFEVLSHRKDGSTFWNAMTVSPIRDDGGEITHFVGVMTDVSDRRTLEETYRHAQKMEAVGQLAGGVAHDFNNLLTVINGYSDVLLASMTNDDPNRELVEEIRQAGQLSSGLTRQLLAFSRKQVLAPAVVNLNEIVGATDKMLRRMIREDVRLEVTLGAALWQVKVDPGQIEQVLMNLAVNARDAMPNGGVLHVDTTNLTVGPGGEVAPGEYVRLSVRDSGVGMPPEVSSRIFEPFFTTKDPGHGTGLGLATVYGIVQQSGGEILVSSAVGEGTTFDIYLPRSHDVEVSTERARTAQPALKGHETVLLVEDEDAVRMFARRVLEAHGFSVLCAGDGLQAAAVADTYDGPIDLLITDLIMPRVGGREVAARLTRDRPSARVLYVSGYTDDALALSDIAEHGAPFLQKPFAADALIAKAREVLDRPVDADA